MNAANKVILNTSILYGRMLVTIGVTFYTTREALGALGVVDYGIYNLIAGVISMLSFLNAAMSTSTQRFLSFHQGKKDSNFQKRIFSTSVVLHFVIALALICFIELIGIFIFNGFLNVPLGRENTAKWIYHAMGISVLFTVLSVPFTASINANEDMLWLSIINIIEVLVKLTIVLVLPYIEGDTLLVYGLLMTFVSLITFSSYFIYCLRKYDECTLTVTKYYDSKLVKNLTAFAGWNLFGALTGIGKTQGVAILLNVFLGSTINASYGIASQVASQVNFFSATMLKALNPRIMKNEGAGNRQSMLKLSNIASKFSYYLLAFIAIPCIFEMEEILKLWLIKVPDHTTTFCRLIILGVMANQLTVGLDSAAQAIGNIKSYMLVAGTIKLMIVPTGYLLLSSGHSSTSVIIGYAVFEGLAGIGRIIILKRIGGLNIKEYLILVIGKCFIPSLLMVCSLIIMTSFFNHPYRFFYSFPISIIIFFASIYFWGLSKDEKTTISSMINSAFSKLRLRWI
ncbi:hypothetical protein DSL64_02730 [Dyadobacter luteus]|uniref:Polysaccharide biosynthesis protein n=1 Tax=Dyadobacter luteus TaxID=2259619 RepID=A0A3D8YJU9_9BACT|nr:hypothetical protein [Dyadobacter luteus]REA64481.1 hypothetical protein DSL64_02730 [Dyadobacter luteus]